MTAFWTNLLTTFLCVHTLAAQDYDHIGTPVRDTILLHQYQDSISCYRASGRNHDLARMYHYIARYFFLQKQKDSTAFYCRQGMHLFGLAGDSMAYHDCMMILGQATIGLHTTPQVPLEWLASAARYFEHHGAPRASAHAYFTIGNYYFDIGQDDLRESYWTKAMSLNAQTTDTLLRIIYKVQRCRTWAREESWEKIIPVALESIEMSQKTKTAHFEKVALFLLAQSYLNTGQMDQAESAFISYFLLPEINQASDEHAHFLMGQLYLQTGRLKQAGEEFTLHRQLLEEKYHRREKDRVDELLVRYEAEKKEAAIQSLRKENELKGKLSRQLRVYIAALVLTMLGLVAALSLIWHNGRLQQRQQALIHDREREYRRQLSLESEKKLHAEFNEQLAEVRLTALNAQMNPHFIFNCMNSIQKYILKNEKQKALEFMQHFSELIRHVLDNSTKSRVALEDEIGMLEKYILLEQQRLDHRFEYSIYVEPQLKQDHYEIPGMILQPFVENAIWHGLMYKEGSGKLELSFERINGSIRCRIEDDGVGREKAAELENQKTAGRKGYGMMIPEKRLQLLEKDHPMSPGITVEDVLDSSRNIAGTRVTLYFHI